MPWLRIDDGFPEHPKLIALGGTRDRWTWLELLAYCARRQTGGVVPKGIGDILKRVTPDFILRAERVGLLDAAEGGHVVHDWATFNPVDGTNAFRQARFRAKSNASRNGPVTETVTPDVTQEVTGRPQPLNYISHLGVKEDDPDERLTAWIEYAEGRADVHNPNAYGRAGYDSGDWPPGGMEQHKPADRPFVCDRCVGGMTFKTQAKLADHLHNVHDAELEVEA